MEEEEDKVFSKLLLTKPDDDTENYSSRIFYYGRNSGAVPFLWESQPGTPKNATASDHPRLPLTPPPSFVTTATSLLTSDPHNVITPNNSNIINNNNKKNKSSSSSLTARLLSKLRASAHHHRKSSTRIFRGCYPVRPVFWPTLRGRRRQHN